MSIAGAIYSKLSGTSAVTALCGTRIYPGTGPESADYPLVITQQISAGVADTRSLDGPARHFRTLYQIDVMGSTQASVQALAKAIRQALDNVVNATWGGVSIKASMFDDQFDGNFEPAPNVYRIIQQYRIVYQE